MNGALVGVNHGAYVARRDVCAVKLLHGPSAVEQVEAKTLEREQLVTFAVEQNQVVHVVERLHLHGSGVVESAHDVAVWGHVVAGLVGGDDVLKLH